MGTAVRSDDEKIRIILAMIPLIGILSSRGSTDPKITSSVSIGNFFFALFILSSSFIGKVDIVTLAILSMYTLYFAIIIGGLFIENQHYTMRWAHWIPDKQALECHFFATSKMLIDIMKLIIGKEVHLDYQQHLHAEYATYERLAGLQTALPFPLPPIVCALPVIQIISLPIALQRRYRDHLAKISESLLITLTLAILLLVGYDPLLISLVLIPACELCVSPRDTQYPMMSFFGVIRRIFSHSQKIREHAETLREKEEVTYRYEVTPRGEE